MPVRTWCSRPERRAEHADGVLGARGLAQNLAAGDHNSIGSQNYLIPAALHGEGFFAGQPAHEVHRSFPGAQVFGDVGGSHQERKARLLQNFRAAGRL